MSSAASVYHEELLHLEGDLTHQLHGLGRAPAADFPSPPLLESRLTVRDGLARLGMLGQALRLEMGQLGASEMSRYATLAASHDRARAVLQAQWHAMTSRGNPDGGSNPTCDTFPPILDSEPVGWLQRVGALQHGALASLQETERKLHQTEGVAAEASTLLGGQTAQIRHAHEGLHDAGTTLRQASRELRAFMRRTARDRVVVSLAVLVLLGLMALVAVSIAKNTGYF
ncbi:unnamed protein product [Phytomonas sp. Hart1]|nr:unnamed protein product [Phytomonas sp. Hart1]|eukprot:CCW69705.1 unnamed protein product [Phytomonas sp. isolate Hart1]